MRKRWVVTLLCAVWLTGPTCADDTLYGEDLAWKLANPSEIRDLTNIHAKLRKESKEADPLFILRPPPFEEIKAAPNINAVPKRITSWEVPPWPTIGLGPPEGPEQEGKPADVWSELDPLQNDAPSADLRPRIVPLDEQFVFRIKEIPKPFSLRRYYDQEDVFFQVAVYGGTTSFRAEEAFRALKEAATRQQKLEGVGKEAFMTRVEITEEPPPDPDAMPFAEVPPHGEARPDLMDSGKASAQLAPAFQDVPVKDLEGRTIHYVEPNKQYVPDTPEVKQSLIVIVGFFPDQAVTVSMAMEERLGTVQDLVQVALMVQRKLRDEIKPG